MVARMDCIAIVTGSNPTAPQTMARFINSWDGGLPSGMAQDFVLTSEGQHRCTKYIKSKKNRKNILAGDMAEKLQPI